MASVVTARGVRVLGMSGGSIDGGAQTNVLRQALDHSLVRSSLSLAGVDPTVCACRAHVRVEHDIVGAVGCASRPLGTAPFVKAASEGDGHVACLAEEATRVLDARFADVVLERAFSEGLVSRASKRLRQRLCTGRLRDKASFGAGYCYLEPIIDKAYSRCARVAGPNAYLVAAAAIASVFGRNDFPGVDVIKISDGLYHCEVTNRQPIHPLLDFLQQCATIVTECGPLVKLGADRPSAQMCGVAVLPMVGSLTDEEEVRVMRAVGWMDALGVHFPGDAQVDLMAVMTASALMPPNFGDVRARVKSYELVGDHFLKVATSMRMLASGESVADYNSFATKHINERLGPLTEDKPLSTFLACGSLLPTSKARGNLVEALLGCVLVHCGFAATCDVGDELNLLPVDRTSVEVEFPRMEPQDVVDTVVSMTQDYKVRGGDPNAFVASLRELIDRHDQK